MRGDCRNRSSHGRLDQRFFPESAEFQKELQEAREKERARQKYEVYMIKGIMASNTLSEATARAVQRIPDAHCNGDMETALEEEEKVKKEIQLFLAKQGVNNIIT